MKNINTIIFNSDLTVREQTESPIQAFSSYQNIVRVIIPFDTSYIPFGVFHATNDAGDVANPTQLILLLPNGTATVDGETYYVYEQKVPEAVVGSLRASKVEFVLSLWASKENFIGVQRYDETAAGYNTTTYIATQLLLDFPNAAADEYVRVFNTETDWEFDGTTWTDTNDVFETVLEDSRSEIVEFALYKGKSTGKPTHKPSNTEAIIESLNLKVNKSGDVMTGALQFANAGLTRLILGTNKITTEDGINATTFDNGDQVSDAVKFSDLTTLFDVTAVTPSGGDNWLDAFAAVIAAKFDEYSKLEDLGTDFLLTNGNSVMTGNINVGGNDVTNVNLVDGVDVSQLKTDYDNHTHTEADITDLDKYTQTQVDNLVNPKVDKTTTIAGVDLQDNITLTELKTAIGNATEALDGLLSKEDKATVNTLTQLLTNDDGDSIVNTLQEILDIFAAYPEGTDIVTALAGKVDNADVGTRTYTEQNVVVNEESVTASIDALDQAVADKADVGHTHTEADITDLDKYTQQEVNDNFAPISHTHTESEITDLDKYTQSQVDTFLNGKIDLDGNNSALGVLNYVGENTTGTLTYDDDRQILQFATTDGTTLQLGGELWFVNAKTNDALTHGDPVQFAGTQGDHFLVKKAVGSEIETNPDYFVGIATHDANANDFVKVTWFGEVSEIATTGWTQGDVLYFDTATSGLTNTEPTTEPIIQVAAVTAEETTPSANNGRILIRPQFKSRKAAEVFITDANNKLAANTVEEAIEELYDKTQTHEDLTNNPHSVTAAQVGAYTTTDADSTFAPISHTHTESEITDLDKYTQGEVDTLLTNKADLVGGKVPSNQLPSYVDDVIEGYYNTADGLFYTDDQFTAGNEITGETGKVYVDLVSGAEIYRWSGSAFTQIIEAVAFGTVAGTAYEGNAGQANADAIANIEDGTTTVPKASQDADGNVITTTYATKTELTEATDELNDIGDVNVASAANGNFLKFDGTNWINAPISGLTTISDTPPTEASAGDLWFDSTSLIMYIYYQDGDSLQWVNTQGGVLEDRVEALSDLNNVNAPTPTDSQVLAYNATSQEWEATTPTSAEYYTITIASGDWSGTDPVTAVKTVSGVLATDRPLIDLDLSSVAFADVETKQTEYAKLYRVAATANDEITFYALEAPTESLDILIKVVR